MLCGVDEHGWCGLRGCVGVSGPDLIQRGTGRRDRKSSCRGRGRVVCAALQVPLDKGERDQCENSSLDAPPEGVLWFCSASQISLAEQNHPLGVLRSGPDRSVRICADRLQVSPSRSRSPRPRPGALVVCGIGVRVRVPFTRNDEQSLPPLPCSHLTLLNSASHIIHRHLFHSRSEPSPPALPLLPAFALA